MSGIWCEEESLMIVWRRGRELFPIYLVLVFDDDKFVSESNMCCFVVIVMEQFDNHSDVADSETVIWQMN
uniref:Ovule protein n=1 Tax=Syphacia muris TaxID=451379 RepID=A0A0N5ABE8_9BILA